MSLNDIVIEQYLTALGMHVEKTNDDEWQVTVPSYRFDINREVDLIEELARLYGYNNLAVQPLMIDSHQSSVEKESWLSLSRLESLLIDRDYQEIISYSFISPEMAELFAPQTQYKTLLNPISQDLSVMRPNLLAGLVQTLQYNINRQQNRVRLFETGLCFEYDQSNKLQQNQYIGGLIYGNIEEENWTGEKRSIDFYDLKGDLESLFTVGNELGEWQPLSDENLLNVLHPGQSAQVIMAGQYIGFAGALHPQVQKKLGLKQTAFVFQIQTKPLQHALLPWFKPLSKFPEMRRDLAFTINKEIQVANIQALIYKEKVDYLKKCRIFDIYTGQNLPTNQKSVALALVFQNEEQTLTDEVVNQSVDIVIKILEQNFSIELRG